MRKHFSRDRGKKTVYDACQNLQLFDREYFFKNFRMDFWIGPIIQNPILRRSNATLEGLCAALLYLATGDSQTTIGISCRISLLKKVSITCVAPQNFRNFSDSFSTEHLRAGCFYMLMP